MQVWRDLYSFACLVAALHHLQLQLVSPDKAPQLDATGASIHKERGSYSTAGSAPSEIAVAAALHELDMAAIMGGPLFRPDIDQLISVAQALYQQHIDASADTQSVKRQKTSTGYLSSASQLQASVPQPAFSKNRGTNYTAAGADVQKQADTVEQQADSALASPLLPPGSLQPGSTLVATDCLPSLER